MPTYLSPLLQPLGVAVLKLLKGAYSELVSQQIQNNYNHIDKLDFLEAFPTAHNIAFKPQTIQNGFTAAGLVLFNPEVIIENFYI